MAETRKFKGQRPSQYKIEDHKRPFQGELFALDTASVAWATYVEKEGDPPGGFGKPLKLEITRRGDAVAALLFDRGKREVILVEQFRIATTPQFRRLIDKSQVPNPATPDIPADAETGTFSDPQAWLLETVAGSLDNAAMSPEDCLKSEILDEAGYAVNRVREIGKYFASPGGSSEMIHLYYAEVTDLQRDSERGGGNESEGEHNDVVKIPLEEFFQRLERREFLDAKIIIAGYWLRDNLGDLLAQPRDKHVDTVTYPVIGTRQKIGIKVGSIVDVDGIDVWVNPENTNMQMDRYFGRSVSAVIRWAGAMKQPRAGAEDDEKKYKVVRDYIADDLRFKLGNRYDVELTEVIETTPGELKKKGVACIMHVAIAEGHFEQGLKANIDTLAACIDRVLATIEHGNWNRHFLSPRHSVLIPIIGAGTGGLPGREVAPRLVARALDFLRTHPRGRLREIYFSAFTMSDATYLRKELDAVARPAPGNAAHVGAKQWLGQPVET